MADEDKIKLKPDIELFDSEGKPIKVETPPQEIWIENFIREKIDKSKL